MATDRLKTIGHHMVAQRPTTRIPWLLLVLVAVLAMRAVIPVGWMPVSLDLGIRLTWCTGVGERATREPAQDSHAGHSAALVKQGSGNRVDPGHEEGEHPGDTTGICAFAAAVAAFAGIPVLLPMPAEIHETTLWLFPDFAVGPALSASLPPPTGPPGIS